MESKQRCRRSSVPVDHCTPDLIVPLRGQKWRVQWKKRGPPHQVVCIETDVAPQCVDHGLEPGGVVHYDHMPPDAREPPTEGLSASLGKVSDDPGKVARQGLVWKWRVDP